MRFLLILVTAAACSAGGGLPAAPPVPPVLATAPAGEFRLDAGDADDTNPQLACEGDLVCAVWRTDAALHARIVFARSTDGGRSWEAPRPVSRNPQHGDARAPWLHVADGIAHVAWEDDRDGPVAIRYTRSLDAGATWPGSDVRLNTDPGGNAARPRLGGAGPVVAAAWQDDRSGRADVYVNRSLDAGATWLGADLRVNTNGPGASVSANPQLAVTPATVLVVWEDDRNGELDLYANRSADSGATWLAGDVRIDRDPPGASRSELGHLVASGGEAWCVWRDFRRAPLGAASDVYLSRATDGGRNWLPRDARVNAGTAFAQVFAPRLASAGDDLYVAWADGRNGEPDIYVARSRDRGVEFERPERRVDRTAPGAAPSLRPRIRVAGSRVDVVWEDARFGHLELYANTSRDGGVTWPETDERIDDDLEDARLFRNFPGQTLAPRFCLAGEVRLTIWQDARPSLHDIYFRYGVP